jgi:hypothetical protein
VEREVKPEEMINEVKVEVKSGCKDTSKWKVMILWEENEVGREIEISNFAFEYSITWCCLFFFNTGTLFCYVHSVGAVAISVDSVAQRGHVRNDH